MVVDSIWSISEKSSERRLHKLFYSNLVSMGFRAHHAKEVYTYAESLAKSAKSNGGRKPVLRKLSARVDRYDYKLDLGNMVLTLKLHKGYEAKLNVDRHGERIKNISWGYAHRVGDLVAELAIRYRSAIILEDLEKLRENNKKGKRFNKRLGLWFYRRIQFCVEYEARERNLEVAKVNPRGTSLKCPRCGKKLAEYGHRVLRCRKCSLIGDRDAIAAINLCKKYVSKYPRCGVPGVTLSAPKPDENPSGVQGKRDDAMKNIKLYEPI
jgi:putative transposase